ncbi:hypothetical protein [Caulobacter sp. BP25]|uniref:hypothetical protein n=1 Tax=Caulobacter sp. BP25 TaxID=2048900 RepID=UPI000C12C711|nr:hypothetical protein [Caulobacter sp. BP25]PHY20151.1 hypothetical protein CSW59_08150 [Caulobacter sp. BP25]
MLKALSRHFPTATGLAALIAWAIALQQSLPRMLAGPICSARGDMFVLAGHCPACYVAAALSIAFLASLFLASRQPHGGSRVILTVDAAL